MNKQDLIGAAAKHLGITKGRATEIVELFFGSDGLIAAELRRGRKVSIAGFGNFEPRTRAARQGRNPRTGTQIQIRASTVPAFRPGKGLKESLNRREARTA